MRLKKFLMPATLYKMLFLHFVNWYVLAQIFGILILVIVDLFGRLDTYMSKNTSILEILYITLLYVPKTMWFTMPFVIMFGVIMAISTLYQSNELIAIFTSGISYTKFTMPIVVFSILLSGTMIFFDSYVVVKTLRHRDKRFTAITTKKKADNNNITIQGEKPGWFWHADIFLPAQNKLQGVILFKVDKDYSVKERIDAKTAVYIKNKWLFKSIIERKWDENGLMSEQKQYSKKIYDFTDKPQYFESSEYDIESMSIAEAKNKIQLLERLNVERKKELTDYYKKFSFPCILIIFSIFAIGVSTISKVYILLIALFLSIAQAIGYYIIQFLIFDNLAYTGIISPMVGAWGPFFMFLPMAIFFIFRAKT